MTIRVDILPDGAVRPLSFVDGLRSAIPGLRWCRDRKAFVGAPHATEAAIAWLRHPKRDVVIRGEAPLVDTLFARVPHRELRDHQRIGADWLIQQCRRTGAGLLADDMGLGKTAQSIRAAEVLMAPRATSMTCNRMKTRPWTLVICPAVVARHWVDSEVPRWSWQGVSTAGLCSVKKRVLEMPTTDFRIVSPEVFRRHSAALDGATCVIPDEAHYYANARAKRTQALHAYMMRQPRRPTLMLLTGTPLTSRPRDLFSLLDLMHPGDWGSFWQFTKRYCAGRYVEIPGTDRASWDTEGISHVDELRMRLKHVMLRRSKAEVGGLPPKIRSMIPVELPARARKSLEAAAREIDGFKGLSRVLGITEAHKLQAATELAASIVEQGGRPLVFTTRRDSAQAIAERLLCPCVTGADAAEDRAAKLANAHAAVCTMFSVTTGVNLTQFDTVIFCGLDWVPSTLLQAEARPHRIGQTRAINVYYLIGLGTVDEFIQHRVIERLDLFDQAIGSAEDGNELRSVLGGGSEEDLIGEIVASVTKGKT